MLNDILTFLQGLPQRLLAIDFLLQAGIFLLALLVAWFLRRVIRKQVDKLQERLKQKGIVMEQFPWTVDLLVALGAAAFPLAVFLLGTGAAGALRASNRPADFLQWAIPVFGLWALYRFAGTLMDLNMRPERARVWHRQILRPLIFLLIFLQVTGLLDDVLNLRLSTSRDALLTLQSVLLGVIVLAFFLFVNRVARRLLGETLLPRAGVEPAVNQVITTFTGYAIVVAGFMLSLSVMGVNLTALTVIIGGLSVGLGFGLQELINNFVSGFILLTERSLAPGDVIEVDGNVGTVQKIGLRTMQITTPDDVELIIPNGHLLGSTVTSFTHNSPEMRIHIGVSAGAETNPRDVQATLLEAAKHPEVLEKPGPVALLAELEGQTIRYDLEFWIARPMRGPYISSDVRLRIWELFSERGIEMDVPQDILVLRPED
ncbi:MAG: mechanosensitive ion channel [Candidatus Promineofilum sp.]|nr:mechanosensitive ion channel [Promineifilum sp.]MBP9656563.1 mechanosensitive ion channel [Promineifilum sp.]